MLNNQQFCYWLQGYFEISNGPVVLKQRQIELIDQTLQSISEPLWPLLSWIQSVCDYCKIQGYRSETLAYFQPLIQDTLANIFIHVVDNSYEVTSSAEERQRIHDGLQTKADPQ